MSVQLPSSAIRTYVAIPFSNQSSQQYMKTLGEDCRKTWAGTARAGNTYTIPTENPCMVVGSFLSIDRQHAEATAKRIQETVTREFDKFVVEEREVLILPYNKPPVSQGGMENSNAKDHFVCPLVCPADIHQRIAQIIAQNGSALKEMKLSRYAGGKTHPLDGNPFVIIGKIQTPLLLDRASDNSWISIPPESVAARLGVNLSVLCAHPWPKPSQKQFEVDPKNLLFFPLSASPENFFNLDFENPMSLIEPPKAPTTASKVTEIPNTSVPSTKTLVNQTPPVEPAKTHVTVEEPKAPSVPQIVRTPSNFSPLAPGAFDKGVEEPRAPTAPTEIKKPPHIKVEKIELTTSTIVQQVSEAQISQSIDTIATIQKRIEELLQTKNMLSSEGLDVSGIVIDIDELKKKRSASIAELYRATNPSKQ
jgi:FtsZ-binding cell division protein ZapB